MSNNCLVTTLQGVVDNDNLRTLSDTEFELLPNSKQSYILIKSSEGNTWSLRAKLINNTSGGLSNKDGSISRGKEFVYEYDSSNPESADNTEALYVGILPNTDGTLLLDMNRSKITMLISGIGNSSIIGDSRKMFGFSSLDYLNFEKFSGGDPFKFLKSNSVFWRAAGYNMKEGFDVNTDVITTRPCSFIIGNESSTTNLYRINLDEINKEAFNNCSNLNFFNLDVIKGDLTYLTLPNYSNNYIGFSAKVLKETSIITGDLSKVSKNGGLLRLGGRICNFTWSNRPSDHKILCFDNAALGELNLGSYVDAMLINQATLDDSSIEYVPKLIRCKGSRTSASDAAIATLTSRGYSIVIDA